MMLGTELLAAVLGGIDVVWRPIRSWPWPAGPNRYFARKRYLTRGVPLEHGADDEVAGKQTQRTISALAARKLVHKSRPTVKTIGLRLADAGETLTRGLCGLPGVIAAWHATKTIADLSKPFSEATVFEDLWVAEALVIGHVLALDVPAVHQGIPLAFRRPNWPDAFVHVENLALPGLIRGWLLSTSDVHGAAYYAVTQCGRTVVSGRPPAEAGRGRRDGGAVEVYLRAHATATERLDTGEPEDVREIAPLPCPVANRGLLLDHVSGHERPRLMEVV